MKIFKWVSEKLYGASQISVQEASEAIDVEMEALAAQERLQQEMAQVENEEPYPAPEAGTIRTDLNSIDKLTSITFYVDPYNNINIRYNWDEDNELEAKRMAHLLHNINSGMLEAGCIKILKSFAESYPNSQLQVDRIFSHWGKIKEEYDDVIKPSEVFCVGNREIDYHFKKQGQQGQ